LVRETKLSLDSFHEGNDPKPCKKAHKECDCGYPEGANLRTLNVRQLKFCGFARDFHLITSFLRYRNK